MPKLENIDEDDDNQDYLSYKIILLGDSTVGKTSLIIRFCDSKFNENTSSTIGVDTKTKYVKFNDKKIELEIWDTAGQERFKCLAKNCYQGADGIILMYDITQKKTFNNIKNWYNEIKNSMNIDKIALIIVGNKSDLPDIQVSKEISENFSEQYGIKLIEISCKENININEIFIFLIEKMMQLDSDYKQARKRGSTKLEENTFNLKRKSKKKCCK